MSDLNIAIASIGANLQPERVLRNTIAAMPAHLRIAGVEELLQMARQDPEPEERLIADLEDVLRETRLQAEPAEAVAQTSPPPTATEAAVQLPPQLAAALGDNAARVADMCFLAPGVPWSNQLLDDMLADLRAGRFGITDCDRNGTSIRVAITLQIVMETRRRARKETLKAHISVFEEGEAWRDARYTFWESAPETPSDRAGLRKQIEWCQATANNIFRRGFCNLCSEGNAEQRPAKRLRVSGTQMCSKCLFKRSL